MFGRLYQCHRGSTRRRLSSSWGAQRAPQWGARDPPPSLTQASPAPDRGAAQHPGLGAVWGQALPWGSGRVPKSYQAPGKTGGREGQQGGRQEEGGRQGREASLTKFLSAVIPNPNLRSSQNHSVQRAAPGLEKSQRVCSRGCFSHFSGHSYSMLLPKETRLRFPPRPGWICPRSSNRTGAWPPHPVPQFSPHTPTLSPALFSINKSD